MAALFARSLLTERRVVLGQGAELHAIVRSAEIVTLTAAVLAHAMIVAVNELL